MYSVLKGSKCQNQNYIERKIERKSKPKRGVIIKLHFFVIEF